MISLATDWRHGLWVKVQLKFPIRIPLGSSLSAGGLVHAYVGGGLTGEPAVRVARTIAGRIPAKIEDENMAARRR